MKQAIQSNNAPAAIGQYSQAVKIGETLYLSGQIPLDPVTMMLVGEDMKTQVVQVFNNIKQVIEAAGLNLDAIVKLTVYLIDISQLSIVNEIMTHYFRPPYPARTSVEVAALPKGAAIEIDAIAVFY